MLAIEGLIKDISDVCISYLSDNERIYYKGETEWSEFDKNNVCDIAAKNGWLDLLIWARKNNHPWNYFTCVYAARNGHLEILKYARRNHCKQRGRMKKFAIKYIKYIKYFKKFEWIFKLDEDCPLDIRICVYADQYSNLEVLKWTRDNGCKCGGKYHKN